MLIATTIRPFAASDADYAGVCAVHLANYPDLPFSPANMRHRDRRDPKFLLRRWVAEVDGEIVAVGEFSHNHWVFHPQKFDFLLRVKPAFQGHGIGSAMFETLFENLQPLDPLVLRAQARDDAPQTIGFYARRGFVEKLRDWESRLDLGTVDFAAWEAAERAVAEQGIEIKSMTELMAGDADAKRKLYDLDVELTADVPTPDTFTPPDFATYSQQVFEHPGTNFDAMFVALNEGEFVGMTALWNDKNPHRMHTGLTGVRRSHRRRKIATALKVRSLRYAKSIGKREVSTFNETGNRGMLAINEALGFAKEPAWILFEKQF